MSGLRSRCQVRAMHRLIRPRSTAFAFVLLGLVALPLGGRIVPDLAANKAPASGRLTATLDVTKLAPIQASEIRLNYDFRRSNTHFAYRLQRRQGKRWATLRAVALEGRFKGAHSTTLKRLFARRAVRPGSYRLRLRADRNLVSLRFSVFAANSVANATNVSAGGALTCILIHGGAVKCWGDNFFGELGNSSLRSSSTPVSVGGIMGAIAVNSGYKHSCAVLTAGTMSCWGTNDVGELGNGSLTSSSSPVSVARLGGVVASSSGAGHTCAVLTGGSLYCWGDNEAGQLGTGDVSRTKPYGVSSPVQVDAVSNAVSLSAGFLNTCVLISGGSIDCWGYNHDGQVGNGEVNHARPYTSPLPTRVVGITSALSISAGAFHTCALIAGGSVECWGYITASDFAPKALLDSAYPVPAPGIKHAVSISSGGFHTCALIAGGTVKCWGANQFGQLGNGKLSDSARPVTVIGIRHAISISSGILHTCAVLRGGAVKCWGGNDEGELGTGTLTSSSVPLSVVQPTASLSR
jgi:alpha-tubulin suppressor-like RCC1 family protein